MGAWPRHQQQTQGGHVSLAKAAFQIAHEHNGETGQYWKFSQRRLQPLQNSELASLHRKNAESVHILVGYESLHP